MVRRCGEAETGHPANVGRTKLSRRVEGEQGTKHWIVSLHGSDGFATDDLAIWHPHLKDRDVGAMCVQWWLGSGDKGASYYTPEQIYREIDNTLQKLGVEPGTAMLHGFSRGSANSYAVMALDAGRAANISRSRWPVPAGSV